MRRLRYKNRIEFGWKQHTKTQQTANMEISYVCEQIDDILGKTMSELDYRLKYGIVYGFMPRPNYIDELKKIFKAECGLLVDDDYDDY